MAAESARDAGGTNARGCRRPGCWALGLIVFACATAAFGLGALALARGQPTASQAPASSETPAPTPTALPPDQRLIFTYYFYWYDATTGAHLQEGSGLNQHPESDPLPSWKNVEWHKKQLSDMTWAGIDIALPVYWGFENPEDAWSYEGLDILAKAWRELESRGARPPKIGMFFDTTIVAGRDLTTGEGKKYFYANIHDFFSRIPREAWGRVLGRPVVFLFTSDFTGAMDQSTFDYVYDSFQQDFGIRPYIVREVSWDYPILRWEGGERVRDDQHPIQTENSYLWAAAIFGFVDRGGVATVGPGYDDRGVPGRQGRVTDREDGAFYVRNFEAAIASGKPLLAIETWNEFHEGSGIADSVEYGRKYLELTRRLSTMFHAYQP